MKENRPQSRKHNLVEQELDGELLIYDLERNMHSALIKPRQLSGRRVTENVPLPTSTIY